MLHRLRDLFLGSPLPTNEQAENRLNKIRALAAFSPDALSSIAYANQEIYLGLIIAGTVGLRLSFPIGLAIVSLLIIVALSYAQTIFGYPSGGGSYVVARENLGTIPGLIAAAALLIDYVLTAAVSLTAGVEAIASAIPSLLQYRIPIALGILLILTLANLRGLKETGSLMSIPVYFFLFAFFAMLIFGGIQVLRGTIQPIPLPTIPPAEALSSIIILHAFAAGCTALTGIESISNGVPAFKAPAAQNARTTLIFMAVLMGLLFIGSIGLTQYLGVISLPDETILSALTRRILGDGILHFVVQGATLLILAVAANTSFAGFPRVTSILAADKFLPRPFSNLGDRLVYTNGIIFLSAGTAALILLFNGRSHLLIPLFAVGAFLAFTLSQSGMVMHWFRIRGKGWQVKLLINGLGALVTGSALLIIGYSKFLQGAWISIFLIAIIVTVLLAIRAQYRKISEQLTLRGLPPSLRPMPRPRVVIPLSGVHRGTIEAVNFARSLSDNLTAVYVEIDPDFSESIQKEWTDWYPDIPLVTVPSPYRSIVAPLLEYLDRTDMEINDGQQAVLILPEFVPAHWWQGFLHNQTAWLIKMALLYGKRHSGYQRVIIDVPYHLKD
jgi:amino acid transporter